MSGRKVWAADEVLTAEDLQDYIQDQVVFVYANASARSAGILAPTEGMVSYLQDTNALEVFDGSAWVDISPNVGTAGTYTKVTTDAKGRVSSGTTLAAADIPNLDTSKINTGTFDASRIASGTLDAARIPNLDAGKIVSGAFSADRIPALDGSKITTGNINVPGSSRSTSLSINNGVGGSSVTMAQNGNVAVGGTLNVSNGFGLTGNLFAPTTYNQTNTGRAMFVAVDGLYGIGASSIRFKENVVDADIDTDAVLDIRVRKFNYKKSFDKHETKDVGVIAEELEALGLTDFIYYDAEGIPDGVAYEKLALLLIPVLKSQAEKLDALEARLDRLEK
jgi:hypothetical protein